MFDCDGVLIDSEPVWEEVRRELVATRGGRWLPDTQDRLMGMSTGEWSAYMAADLDVGMSPQEVAAAVIGAMAARYAEHLPLMPGAVEAVTALAGRWPLAVAARAAVAHRGGARCLRPAVVVPGGAVVRAVPRGKRPPTSTWQQCGS